MKVLSMGLRIAVFVLVASLPRSAFALCVTPFDQGNWINNATAARRVTRIQVSFICNDQILCSVDANGNVTCSKPGAPFRVHLFGKCSPTDCDWGTVDGNEVTIGSTKWVYSFYDQGFARRYVYITPLSSSPDQLYLWMYTDFVDPARADYVTTATFHR